MPVHRIEGEGIKTDLAIRAGLGYFPFFVCKTYAPTQLCPARVTDCTLTGSLFQTALFPAAVPPNILMSFRSWKGKEHGMLDHLDYKVPSSAIFECLARSAKQS